MVRQAKQVGLDGVVITEHDWLWTKEELKELRTAAPGLVVLAGIEVTAWEGHFLVYGVHNPFALFRGIRVAALCQEVHHQGGVVVAASVPLGTTVRRNPARSNRHWTAWNSFPAIWMPNAGDWRQTSIGGIVWLGSVQAMHTKKRCWVSVIRSSMGRSAQHAIW